MKSKSSPGYNGGADVEIKWRFPFNSKKLFMQKLQNFYKYYNCMNYNYKNILICNY